MASARAERERLSQDWGLRIAPLSSASAAWNRFAGATREATLYHRERWLRVLEHAYRLKLRVVLASDARGATGAGCLLAEVRTPLQLRMVGLPFSDGCPPLWHDAEAMAALLRWMEEASRQRMNFELRGIAAPLPWKVADHFLDWRLDLDRPASRLEATTSSHFRRQVRSGARQGISIERGSDSGTIRRFYALMLETRRRHGLPPPPLRLFEAAAAEFAPCDFSVWMARKGGRDLAGAFILRDGPRLYYRWAARTEPSPPGANHLLMWTLIENSAKTYASLELGRSDLRNDGLNRFKRDLGAVSRTLPYSFVPATQHRVSPEALTGLPLMVSRLWRHLPLPVTRLIGTAAYRYFA
jgi:hypothetical protein